LPSRGAMIALDGAVRFGQRQAFDRQAVMLYQRVLLQRRCRLSVGWSERRSFIAGTFDKYRHDGRRDVPAIVLRRFVEKAPIILRRRQELNVVKSAQVHSQSTRIFEKQFWMGTTGYQPTGFLFVEVGGKALADFWNWTAN